MFIATYLSTFLIINKNTDFIRSWKRFQLKKSSILKNILPLYKKVALDFYRGVLKIAPTLGTERVKIPKNALNMFIKLQKSIEFQLIHHEIPQPSSRYCIPLIFRCWLCACIPCCCCPEWNDVTHFCPQCNNILGKYRS